MDMLSAPNSSSVGNFIYYFVYFCDHHRYWTYHGPRPEPNSAHAQFAQIRQSTRSLLSGESLRCQEQDFTTPTGSHATARDCESACNPLLQPMQMALLGLRTAVTAHPRRGLPPVSEYVNVGPPSGSRSGEGTWQVVDNILRDLCTASISGKHPFYSFNQCACGGPMQNSPAQLKLTCNDNFVRITL